MSSERKSNITVVGSGTMGNGIAHVFAQHGFSVTLHDLQQDFLDRGLRTIASNLDRQIKKGTLSEGEKNEILARIRPSLDLQDACGNADLIVEAATENASVKKELFRKFDQDSPPSALLASNTSSISITEIAAVTRRPEKVIGMHFMNPVPVMKLVEIIRGLATSDQTFQTVKNLSEQLEKVPVEVNDYPGFISNRVLLPMLNEAMYCVMEGVATPEAIDTVMKLGMNHPMGPLQLADFIGLDVCLSIMQVL
ncbi:MAG: 3-hydroxyacyl-CoA dehydrogenase NAD-binding domain-containing protein, partial [Bacteroidota bacterium]